MLSQLLCHFIAAGISIIIIVTVILNFKKVNSSKYNKRDEKGSEHIQMMTKDSDGWKKYNKLEDGDNDDSSDSTTADEHKKMLN